MCVFPTGSAEEHTGLSRALTQLAELEEKMEQLHHDQVRMWLISLRFYLPTDCRSMQMFGEYYV